MILGHENMKWNLNKFLNFLPPFSFFLFIWVSHGIPGVTFNMQINFNPVEIQQRYPWNAKKGQSPETGHVTKKMTNKTRRNKIKTTDGPSFDYKVTWWIWLNLINAMTSYGNVWRRTFICQMHVIPLNANLHSPAVLHYQFRFSVSSGSSRLILISSVIHH